jgi:hypothetical protein
MLLLEAESIPTAVLDIVSSLSWPAAFCSTEGDRFGTQAHTWVRQVAEAIGIVQPNSKPETARNAILSACLRAGVSAIRFNQGAWCVGANSLNILLKEFGRPK